LAGVQCGGERGGERDGGKIIAGQVKVDFIAGFPKKSRLIHQNYGF
jgi:hypothetical protein